MSDVDGLFAAHQRGVFRYLCRVVGCSESARDLTQEVFLRVARAAVPAADDAGQRAWVFRIARNLALNHVRDRRRAPTSVPLVEIVRPATQEVSVALDEALATLAALDRDVFLLREAGGLSYTEVAAACEITIEAVRGRLHRARQHLREQLRPALADARSRGVQW